MSEQPVERAWERAYSEPGPDLKLFRARYDFMRNPRNGHLEKMIVLESFDSTQTVARTTEGTLLFVYQYRFGIGEFTLELPGGIVEPSEPLEAAARRELAEETGYENGEWKLLGQNPANPVFQDSQIYTFAASGVTPTANLPQDQGEDVQLVYLTEEATLDRFLSGAFRHPHTVAGLLHYFGNRLR